MTEQLKELIARRATTMERIWEHYEHAREKHPYFCDIIDTNNLPFDFAGWSLEDCRNRLAHASATGVVTWLDLLDCEKYEAQVEINRGNSAAAIDECLDAIAVLLRVIDVLEGRQKLGKPEKGATE